MNKMFENCENIEHLDLTSFDTENVTAMTRMFANCSSLTTIYASSKFNTENVENSNGMCLFFTKCELNKQKLLTFIKMRGTL